MIKKIVLFFILLLCEGVFKSFGQASLKQAKAIADRLIEDTSFELRTAPVRKPNFPTIITQQNIQESRTVKFRLKTNYAKKYRLGISTDGTLRLLIDDIPHVISGENPFPREIAYDTYLFENYLVVDLKEGTHTLQITPSGTTSLGFVSQTDMADNSANIIVIENGIDKQIFESRFIIPETAVFRKHSYAEWHYANATTLLGLLTLADATGEQKYYEHVQQFCKNTINLIPLFAQQYYDQGALRTQNYRLFRRSMLDDTTAPAVPFVELALRDKTDTTYHSLIRSMANYAMNEQFRLPDGTFVRPEPRWTVWSDDLFMSTAFLIRYAAFSGDSSYLEEAVRQVILFDRHLRDPESGLIFHGWNDSLKRHVGAFWGRANGWFAWALSEVLLKLPVDHPQFETLRRIHQSHLEALVSRQAPNGMWHQLLDRPDTYEESSATAIFVLTLARAIRNKWIYSDFTQYAFNGWQGLTTKFAPEGIVHGICRSMSIANDPTAYANRETADNDPRGLGAVFTAAVEIAALEQTLKSKSTKSKNLKP